MKLRHRVTSSTNRLVLSIAVAATCLARDAKADQVGIDKVRLVEQQVGEYLLEVDTSPRFAAAYRNPVLPKRLELTDFRRERQPGYLVLRYQFRSRGQPLDGDDELLLPWGRSGASITAQWNDGSVHQNLFLRDFEGIRVPIRMLKPTRESPTERAQHCLWSGVAHGWNGWPHWLLVAAAAFLVPGWWRGGLIALFAVGQAISLVLADVGVLVIPGGTAEMCVVVAALLMARIEPGKSGAPQRFVVIMVMLGTLHGVASASALRQSGVMDTELVQALFWFNLGVDAWQLAAVTLASAVAVLIASVLSQRRGSLVKSLIGGSAVALLLIAISGGSLSRGSNAVEPPDAAQFELPGAQMVTVGTGSRPRPARVLRRPIASFLTVEPFQVRLEVLIRLAHAEPWIASLTDQETIEVDRQSQLKQSLVDLIADNTVMQIDAQKASPDMRRADFVTVEANGIFSRAAPVRERLDDAVVGVTFVYDTTEIANDIQLDWNLFSSEIQTVAATTTDPFGGTKRELSPDDRQWVWKNRWSGYRPPQIKPVSVDQPHWPLPSVILFAIAGGVYVFLSSSRLRTTVTILLLTTAFVTYPFARVSVGTSILPTSKPTSQQVADILDRLLTNVYRAYDMRDEEAIYDRLALTITGEQLTDIYLDTQRSLELENRGGARATVDEVEILDVLSVESVQHGGLLVELTWNVSGSVTHFGHTHYRRNRYRAFVDIVPADGHWKIQSIQVGEQDRML